MKALKIKFHQKGLAILIASICCISVFAQETKTASILYHRGLHLEEVKGELEQATAVYQQVLEQYTKERELSAKAQLHIGICYEKLGKKEARKAYRRVIRDFADQTLVVADARTRLAGLSPPAELAGASGMRLEQIPYEQLNTPFARLSPDGKKMAYDERVNGELKRIRVLDLDSGTDNVVVDGKIRGFSFVWSPDSKSLAYTSNRHELRVKTIDGNGSQILFENPEYQIHPSDWSRDGKYIVCQLEGKDWTTRIAVIPIGSGEPRFLISGNSTQFRSAPKFSPDGNYVACALDRSGNTDVYVWAVDGSREIRVTRHPARDEQPHWSPDRKYLVFLSDRSKNADLWAFEMQEGAPVRTPFIIKRDLGWRTEIYDLTASGKMNLFMVSGSEPPNLFVVPVDQEKGVTEGSFSPISIYPTDHIRPHWSPNGRMVVYKSRKGEIAQPQLFVLNEDGTERELSPRGHYVVNVGWHPDGGSLLFAGWDQNGKAGIFNVSLKTEEINTLFAGNQIGFRSESALVNLHWLPAARKMMFFKLLGGGDVEIHTADENGQNHKVVVSRVQIPSWGSPSPDAKHVSYVIGDSLKILSIQSGVSRVFTYGSAERKVEYGGWSSDGQHIIWKDGRNLNVFSIGHRRSRTLLEVSPDRVVGDMTWSPNSDFVAFTVKDTSVTSERPPELYIVDSEGGLPRRLAEGPQGYTILEELKWSPSGKKILVSGVTPSSSRAPWYEYWVMEDFLPELTASK